MSKITRPQIYIIGAVLAVIAGCGIAFGLIKPALEEFDAQKAKYDSRNAVAITRPQAERKVKDAKEQVQKAESNWAQYLDRYMPPIDVSNTYNAWQSLVNEQVNVLGPKLDRFIKQDKDVRILQANFALPAAPDDPNAAVSEVFVFSPGSVQVAGSFSKILKHVERWNDFDRLALVTGFQLSGNSPNLVGQYALTVYEFTRGDKTKATNIPQAGNAGGMGGGMGGMMGGMSGMGAGMAGMMGPGGAGGGSMGGK